MVFTRLGVQPEETIEAELSKDGLHVQQGINVLSGSTIGLAWRDRQGAPVAGFDELDLYLRRGPTGSSVDLEIPLESPDWSGTLTVGTDTFGPTVPLSPDLWSFDGSVLRVHVEIGGEGGTPFDGVQTVVHVEP